MQLYQKIVEKLPICYFYIKKAVFKVATLAHVIRPGELSSTFY